MVKQLQGVEQICLPFIPTGVCMFEPSILLLMNADNIIISKYFSSLKKKSKPRQKIQGLDSVPNCWLVIVLTSSHIIIKMLPFFLLLLFFSFLLFLTLDAGVFNLLTTQNAVAPDKYIKDTRALSL